MLRVKDLAITQQGVLCEWKNCPSQQHTALTPSCISSHPHIIHEIFFPPGVMSLENNWRSDCTQRTYAVSLLPTRAAGIPATPQHIPTPWSQNQSALPVQPTLTGLFSEGSRAQHLAKQPSWGFAQRVCCPAWSLFTASCINSARSSAKSSLSQGKLHLCHFRPDLHTSNKIPANLFPSQLP